MSEQLPEDEHGVAGRRQPPLSPTRRYSLGRDLDMETRREGTRRHVALILVLLLATVALSLIALVAAGELSIDEAKDLAATVLSPVIAVTGAALGFYFGHRD